MYFIIAEPQRHLLRAEGQLHKGYSDYVLAHDPYSLPYAILQNHASFGNYTVVMGFSG